nr:DUF3617 domain-containing protein [uncultured Rhodoferax sp.]
MHRTLLACTTMLLTAVASAQTVKPGLWEITNQMQGAAGSKVDAAMAQMQKQMAAMSPEQRKMMEDMMAKKGLQMGTAPGGGVAVKVCITPEMAARNDVAPRQQGGCTHTASPRTGNTQKFSYACTQPSSRGEGEVTYTSAEAYTMAMKTVTTLKGKEETMDMRASGKWLGSDCGSVKPLEGAKG